jgi:hypothetical protein
VSVEAHGFREQVIERAGKHWGARAGARRLASPEGRPSFRLQAFTTFTCVS